MRGLVRFGFGLGEENGGTKVQAIRWMLESRGSRCMRVPRYLRG